MSPHRKHTHNGSTLGKHGMAFQQALDRGEHKSAIRIYCKAVGLLYNPKAHD